MTQTNKRFPFLLVAAAAFVTLSIDVWTSLVVAAKMPDFNRVESSKQTPAQRQAASLIEKAHQCNMIMESEEAMELSNKAMKLDPKNSVALLTRAEALKALGQLDQSIADYKLASTCKDLDVQKTACRSLAEIYFYLKRYSDGIATLSALEKKNLSLTDGMLECRAKCYMAIGKNELAAQDLSLAIKGIPDKTRLVVIRAKAYSDSHQWAKALADYNSMIASDSASDSLFGSNSELYTERAKVYDALGKKAQAAQDRQRAKQLESANYNLAPFRSEKRK